MLFAGRQLLRVQASQQTDAPNKTEADSNVRQMLGMKGAALETDKFKIRVQLTKPVTWVPLIWGEQRLQLLGMFSAVLLLRRA
jgi:chlorophyll synthase